MTKVDPTKSASEALALLLKEYDCENIKELAKTTYKETSCGAWISVKLHDGTVITSDKLRNVQNDQIQAIQVGTIVENSDAETKSDWVYLSAYSDPKQVVAAFKEAIESVEEFAQEMFGINDLAGLL